MVGFRVQGLRTVNELLVYYRDSVQLLGRNYRFNRKSDTSRWPQEHKHGDSFASSQPVVTKHPITSGGIQVKPAGEPLACRAFLARDDRQRLCWPLPHLLS